jgi:hypothetical protein
LRIDIKLAIDVEKDTESWYFVFLVVLDSQLPLTFRCTALYPLNSSKISCMEYDFCYKLL